MPGSLDTTNTMLAIIAAVAVLQGLVLLGLGFAGWKIYKTATETMREIDVKRVQPLTAKVETILDSVHRLTDRVQHRAEKVEAAIDDTVHRVNQTTTGVKDSVSDSVHRVSGVVTSLRSLLVSALTTDGNDRHQAPRAVPTSGQHHIHEETREVREGGF